MSLKHIALLFPLTTTILVFFQFYKNFPIPLLPNIFWRLTLPFHTIMLPKLSPMAWMWISFIFSDFHLQYHFSHSCPRIYSFIQVANSAIHSFEKFTHVVELILNQKNALAHLGAPTKILSISFLGSYATTFPLAVLLALVFYIAYVGACTSLTRLLLVTVAIQKYRDIKIISNTYQLGKKQVKHIKSET